MKNILSFFLSFLLMLFDYIYIYIILNFIGSFMASAPEVFVANLKNISRLPLVLIEANPVAAIFLIILFFGGFTWLNYYFIHRVSRKKLFGFYGILLLTLSIPFLLFGYK